MQVDRPRDDAALDEATAGEDGAPPPGAGATGEPVGPGADAGEGGRGRRRPGGVRVAVDGVLVAAVVAAAALRLGHLGAQSLWYDEWLTSEATAGGLRDLFRHVADREGIPVPYFLLLWGWVRVFGDGDVALRSVSALAGIATVPVAYAVARELRLPRTAARVAALLVAVNPLLVWYSQEARPYALLALAGAVSVLALARLWHRGRTVDLVVWSAACGAAVAVHYFAVFVVVAEAGALLVARRLPWRRVALAGAPAGLVLAALAPMAARQHSHAANRLWITDFPLAARLREAAVAALAGPAHPDDRLWQAAALAVAVAAVLAVLPLAGRRRAVPGGVPDGMAAVGLLAGVGAAGVALPLVATAVGVDVVVGRYLIAALVPLVVAVAAVLAAPPGAEGQGTAARWAGGAAVAVLLGVSLAVVVAVPRDDDLQKPDWAGVADAVRADGGGQAGATRLVLVDRYRDLAGPLRHYLPTAVSLDDGAVAVVDEIDVVTATPSDAPCDFLVGRACSLVFLGGPLPDDVLERVSGVESTPLGGLVVTRYRADEALTVGVADLVPPDRVDGTLALVVPPA